MTDPSSSVPRGICWLYGRSESAPPPVGNERRRHCVFHCPHFVLGAFGNIMQGFQRSYGTRICFVRHKEGRKMVPLPLQSKLLDTYWGGKFGSRCMWHKDQDSVCSFCVGHHHTGPDIMIDSSTNYTQLAFEGCMDRMDLLLLLYGASHTGHCLRSYI